MNPWFSSDSEEVSLEKLRFQYQRGTWASARDRRRLSSCATQHVRVSRVFGNIDDPNRVNLWSSRLPDVQVVASLRYTAHLVRAR